jgi:phenylpropionate dioxygenase-like ring-hydroxylating dioxygenase large terminal subunit
MTLSYRPQEMLDMVNNKTGLIDRRIFSDQDIYQLELEQIFARAWNFMCHDTQIPNPGDFFMSYIGEDRVLCVRDNEGKPSGTG